MTDDLGLHILFSKSFVKDTRAHGIDPEVLRKDMLAQHPDSAHSLFLGDGEVVHRIAGTTLYATLLETLSGDIITGLFTVTDPHHPQNAVAHFIGAVPDMDAIKQQLPALVEDWVAHQLDIRSQAAAQAQMPSVLVYTAPDGKCPFMDLLARLMMGDTEARNSRRLDGGIAEFRLATHGAGIARVYVEDPGMGRNPRTVLLGGSGKEDQQDAIVEAQKNLAELKQYERAADVGSTIQEAGARLVSLEEVLQAIPKMDGLVTAKIADRQR